MSARPFASELLFVAVLSGFASLLRAEPDPAAILTAIVKRVAADQARLPNYTCRQTIERSTRPDGGKKWSSLDTLRLDVALISGKELFAWPGSSKFEDKPIDQMVSGPGAIGNGTFAVHLRNLFLTRGPEFYYAGETVVDGRPAVRFDYKVARDKSGFEVGDGDHSALVAYSGSFWADRKTLDLIRVFTRVDEVPPPVRVSATRDTIDYARVRIGESDFLLPSSAEMVLVWPHGEARNMVRLDSCRQYVGESVVTFGDAPETQAANPVRVVNLPAGLWVEVTLRTGITRDTAVGDAVSADLARDLKSKDGALLLPKGARFTGRVTRLERRRSRSSEYGVIGIILTEAEAPGLKAQFHWELDSVGISRTGEFFVPNSSAIQPIGWNRIQPETAMPQPDEGVFCIKRTPPVTTPGLRMLWRTR